MINQAYLIYYIDLCGWLFDIKSTNVHLTFQNCSTGIFQEIPCKLYIKTFLFVIIYFFAFYSSFITKLTQKKQNILRFFFVCIFSPYKLFQILRLYCIWCIFFNFNFLYSIYVIQKPASQMYNAYPHSNAYKSPSFTGASSASPSGRSDQLLLVPELTSTFTSSSCLSVPSTLAVGQALDMARRTSSGCSSIFDLTSEGEALEKAIRDNDTRATRRIIEQHPADRSSRYVTTRSAPKVLKVSDSKSFLLQSFTSYMLLILVSSAISQFSLTFSIEKSMKMNP